MKKTLISLFIIFTFALNINNYLFKYNIDNDPNIMEVHYIDVGQGDSILIRVNNKVLLIDSGPKSSKSKLTKYLNSLNIKNIDYLIATHPHEDHIGNISTIINNYKVNKFYSPKVTTNTKTFEKIVSTLKNNNLKITILDNTTSSINLGNNTSVKVYSPIEDFKDDNLNNYSPIIKITFGKTSFLFTGDAEEYVEKQVVNNVSNLSSNVLKLGHHGSSSSSCKEFLDAVNPDIAIITVGIDNEYGHPHNEVLDLLKSYKIKTYRTDNDGSIILISDGKNILKKATKR